MLAIRTVEFSILTAEHERAIFSLNRIEREAALRFFQGGKGDAQRLVCHTNSPLILRKAVVTSSSTPIKLSIFRQA